MAKFLSSKIYLSLTGPLPSVAYTDPESPLPVMPEMVILLAATSLGAWRPIIFLPNNNDTSGYCDSIAGYALKFTVGWNGRVVKASDLTCSLPLGVSPGRCKCKVVVAIRSPCSIVHSKSSNGKSHEDIWLFGVNLDGQTSRISTDRSHSRSPSRILPPLYHTMLHTVV